MSPEDRDAITTSLANLWTLHAMVLSALMRGLQDGGTLPPAVAERVLEHIDAQVDALEGEDDQQFATEMLATVRRALQGG